MTDAIWKTRLARAFALILIPLACLAALSATAEPGQRADERATSSQGIDARALMRSASVQDFVKRIEALAEQPDAKLPPAFAEEVGLLDSARDIRVDPSGTVIGCKVDERPAAALEALRTQLAKRGWRGVSLGGVEGSTFVKDEGECTWMLVTASSANGGSEVVYRCPRQ